MGPKSSKDCSCGDWGRGGQPCWPACPEHRQFVILGMKEVAMARHGLILNDNEATGSGKVFKYLPGLRDITFLSKMTATIQKYKHTNILTIFANISNNPYNSRKPPKQKEINLNKLKTGCSPCMKEGKIMEQKISNRKVSEIKINEADPK